MINRTLVGRRQPNIAPVFAPRAPYSPLFQADQAQIAQLQAAVRAGSMPLGEAIDRIVADNLPPQVHQVAFIGQLAVTNVPQLVLPYNTNRMSILIGNTSAANSMFFSFDFPSGKSAGIPLGIPIISDSTYQETNGTVSINEVWVWGTAGDTVLIYEGTLSITGNKL